MDDSDRDRDRFSSRAGSDDDRGSWSRERWTGRDARSDDRSWSRHEAAENRDRDDRGRFAAEDDDRQGRSERMGWDRGHHGSDSHGSRQLSSRYRDDDDRAERGQSRSAMEHQHRSDSARRASEQRDRDGRGRFS
jgi:hypothetical protein